MTIKAEVITDDDGPDAYFGGDYNRHIKFKIELTDDDCLRFRRLMNAVKGEDFSENFDNFMKISEDIIDAIQKNSYKLYL